MNELFAKYEVIHSLYSDHELKHFEDLARAKRLASGKEVDEKDVENASKQTAVDFEDASNLELKGFRFAQYSQEQESNSDKTSLDRYPDRRLILATKLKQGNTSRWLVPTSKWKSDETLRQTAERALASICKEPSLQVKFLGNCPAAVYSYNYPKPLRDSEKADGAKIFFFKAQVTGGNLDANTLNKESVEDFQWLNRTEYRELMISQNQRRYWNAINGSLLYEEHELDFIPRVLSAARSRLTRSTEKEKVAVKL
ncbi:39S ribosomal protein L46, mitochondrial [Halotydeus destructor]|nr:39S ribosomal protein L46, mitochondrial [Halotydeus destructor]